MNLNSDQNSTFRIENSVYDDPNNVHLQCTFLSKDAPYAGWIWYKPIFSAKPDFPNLIFEPVSSIPVDQISKFVVGIDATVNGAGRYNLILDIWFANQSKQISDELMVFLLRHGQGMDTREFMYDGYNTYSYFSFKSNSQREHIFAVEGSAIPRLVNVTAMLEHMARKGYSPAYFLNLELGDELFQGLGETIITQYNVTINAEFRAFRDSRSSMEALDAISCVDIIIKNTKKPLLDGNKGGIT